MRAEELTADLTDRHRIGGVALSADVRDEFAGRLRARLSGLVATADVRLVLLLTTGALPTPRPQAPWCPVEIGETLLVGPLMVPRPGVRAGCVDCARRRRRSAPGQPVEPTDAQVATLITLISSAMRGDTSLVGRIAEIADGELLWHKVVPVAGCPRCRIDPVAPSPSDDELPESLAGWVDPLTGVIPGLTVRQPLGDDPDLPWLAQAEGPRLPDSSVTGPDSVTTAATRVGAVRSAVAATVARYSAALPDPARLRWARAAELDGDRLDPREFPLYRPAQYARPGFPYVQVEPDARIPWVRGRWLGGTRPVWVPAEFAYLAGERRICPADSAGLAAGDDPAAVAVAATLDLVNRDALMAAILTGARGRHLELDDSLDPGSQAILDAVRGKGLTVEVYLLPSGRYGWTVLCLALGDGRRTPAVAIGLGSDRSARAAIGRAALDLTRTTAHLATLMAHSPDAVPTAPERVVTAIDHAAYYVPSHRVAAFDRLRCGGSSRLCDVPEPVGDTTLVDLTGALVVAGVRTAIVDVTSQDVTATPLRVLRAISPDLQPAGVGHGLDRAPLARLVPHLLPENRRPVHPIW